MKSKLIAVVLLVCTMGQSYIVLSSELSCVQSEKVLNDVSKIDDTRSEAISFMIAAHKPLYDTLDRLAAEYVFDMTPNSGPENVAYAFSPQDLVKYKKGADYFLSSIPFALKKSCYGVDETRRKIHAVMESVAEAIPSVISLGLDGNYPENRDAIEEYRDKLIGYEVQWVGDIYDLIFDCLKTTDDDELAAFETAKNGSIEGIQRAVGAFFRAVKLISVAITYENKNLILLNAVEETRVKCYDGLREGADRLFGLLEGFYVNFCTKQSGQVCNLNAIQYASITTSYITGQFGMIVFDEILYHANRIQFDFDDFGEELLSRTDVAKVKVTALMFASIDRFLKAFTFIYPKTLNKVENARKPLYQLLTSLAASYFEYIRVALNTETPYWKSLAVINDIRNEQVAVLGTLAKNIVALINENRVWHEGMEDEFTVITRRIIARGNDYIENLKIGAEILAKISHGMASFGTDYISEIKAADGRGYAAMIDYVHFVLNALRFSYFASSEK